MEHELRALRGEHDHVARLHLGAGRLHCIRLLGDLGCFRVDVLERREQCLGGLVRLETRLRFQARGRIRHGLLKAAEVGQRNVVADLELAACCAGSRCRGQCCRGGSDFSCHGLLPQRGDYFCATVSRAFADDDIDVCELCAMKMIFADSAVSCVIAPGVSLPSWFSSAALSWMTWACLSSASPHARARAS